MSKNKNWLLSVHMNTDDDAEIYYKGKLHCWYGSDLVITKAFKSREKAVAHLRQNVRVIFGGKADEFTAEWLSNAVKQLAVGEDVESVGGNQDYSASVQYVEFK